VDDFLRSWGYLGIFLGIIATGIGFPMPEELPIVIGGVLASTTEGIVWWIMLPVCILGVVIGDGLLYGIGRLCGPRLLEIEWVKKRLLPPERREKIERNFHEHGIKILLFARLTPGIRGTIFFTAGLTRLPLGRFIFADGIYAIPGVSLLYFLGYWFAGNVVNLMEDVEHVKSIIFMVAILAVAGYFLYRFLRRPMVTGDPKEVPKLVEQVTHGLEQVTTKIMHPLGKNPTEQPCAAPPSANNSPGPSPEHPEKVAEEKKEQV
jgi:membrane protein DedA with SNARE-associated domain